MPIFVAAAREKMLSKALWRACPSVSSGVHLAPIISSRSYRASRMSGRNSARNRSTWYHQVFEFFFRQAECLSASHLQGQHIENPPRQSRVGNHHRILLDLLCKQFVE